MHRFILLCQILVLYWVSTQQAFSQSVKHESVPRSTLVDTYTPNVLPSLEIPRKNAEITIDGDLEETGWQSAARARNFSETYPGDQTRPSIGVSAMITYDEDYLYVGYIIKDDPTAIRANLSDRDNIWQDDFVGLVLDPNGDGQTMYFIASNPLGIQGDSRISLQNEEESFNLIYKSAGKITATGYQVEMAIPFKSLRFPPGEHQMWRANFWITHPREDRNTYSWAAISRDDSCWSCQIGTIHGISNVQSGRNLEILPAVTGASTGALNQAGDSRSGFKNERVNIEPSLNVKYGITSSLTVDATLNPDYSQIESDQAQIDVNSTFALFFDERRPFFQEGSDLFNTEIQTVYTRSINDPIMASKLTGRFGSISVAYIGARDNRSPLLLPFEEKSRLLSAGKSVSNIMRVVHNFKNNSYIGVLATDRRLDSGGSGSTIGIDGRIRLWKNYNLETQYVMSRSVEPVDSVLSAEIAPLTFGDEGYTAVLDGEKFAGHAFNTELGRSSRYWDFEIGYEAMSPTFRAENGFVRQNNNRRVFAWQGFTLYPEKWIPFLNRVRPNIAIGRRWNFDGLEKGDFISPGLSLQMKPQTNISIRYIIERERFAGIYFDGLRQFRGRIFSNFSEPVQVGISFNTGLDIARSVGTPQIGRNMEFSVFGSLRPNQRLIIQPRVNYSRLTNRETGEEFFSGYIARLRTSYQFLRGFFMRTVVQYNQFNETLEIDPLISYKINAFTAFHVGSTHDLDRYAMPDRPGNYFRQDKRQIFFKFQYIFRT